MKTWKIPVYWEVCSVIDVEADTLSEAIEIAKDDEGIIPLPTDPDYIDGSWSVSELDEDVLRECYNDNQEDEIVEEIE